MRPIRNKIRIMARYAEPFEPWVRTLRLIFPASFLWLSGCVSVVSLFTAGFAEDLGNAILDNPEDYAPTWHGGVESQIPWLQIHDDLPRAKCEDSPFLHKAWESMGASDPEKWVKLEYEQAKLLDDDPNPG